MTTDHIDRLAAFCKLERKGYRRDPECGVLCEPEWVRDVPGGVEIWRPDESDDDCRVVLEECRQRGLFVNFQNAMFDDWLSTDSIEARSTPFTEWLILATPAEKCAAVLRVLEGT